MKNVRKYANIPNCDILILAPGKAGARDQKEVNVNEQVRIMRCC